MQEMLSAIKPNEVIILIWFNSDKKIGGHVSIKTDKHYVSFWPSQPDDVDFDTPAYIKHRFTSSSYSSYFRTLDYDLIKEGHDCLTFKLSKLNVDIINQEIETIIKKDCLWTIYGSSFASSLLKLVGLQNFNCCGLSYYLLQKGGARLYTHHIFADLMYTDSLLRYTLSNLYYSIDDYRLNFELYKILYKINHINQAYYMFAHLLIESIEKNYADLMKGSLLDILLYRFNLSPTKFLIIAFSYCLKKLFFDNERQHFHYIDYTNIQPHQENYITQKDYIPVYIITACTSIVFYIFYQRTFSPKNIADMVQYAKENESGKIKLVSSSYYSQEHSGHFNAKKYILNRRNLQTLISILYFIVCTYKKIADESLTNQHYLLIKAIPFSILHVLFYRLIISDRKILFPILLGATLYVSLQPFLYTREIINQISNSSIFKIFFSGSLSINRYLYQLPVNGYFSNLNYYDYYPNKITGASGYILKSFPLVPLSIMLTNFLIDRSISNGISVDSEKVTEPSHQRQKTWCTFFYDSGKKILHTSITYAPFIIGTSLTISALNRFDPFANRPNM